VPLTIEHLRQQAIAASLFETTTLKDAIQRLGFVQADPIRSPARAQDLILRHRVRNYRAGDLEAQYPTLDLEEDFLYAYGFVPPSTWHLLHPRPQGRPTLRESKVLEVVSANHQIHPRELEAHLGKKRETNAWGGYSKATTRTLQALHYRGLLRIAGRENGIRLYETATRPLNQLTDSERLRQLVLLIARILAPLPVKSLRAALRMLGYAAPNLAGRNSAVTRLIAAGDLETAQVQEVQYAWPAGEMIHRKPETRVRFLAPFDPLVWDRQRFQQFWGWPYRFEAYTPLPARKLGYYAMPLLWRDDVIGWVNISNRAGEFKVEHGYTNKEPNAPSFKRAFDSEVEQFRTFLQVRKS
jgi:uncharacterized protein YcaQ